jgi:hypothetical protein
MGKNSAVRMWCALIRDQKRYLTNVISELLFRNAIETIMNSGRIRYDFKGSDYDRFDILSRHLSGEPFS